MKKLLVVLLVLLAWTSKDAILEKYAMSIIPDGVVEFAEDYLANFPQHKFDVIIEKMAPSLRDRISQEQIVAIARLFPADKPKRIKIGKASWEGKIKNKTITSAHLIMRYEYENTDQWLFVDIGMKKNGDTFNVTSIQVRPMRD